MDARDIRVAETYVFQHESADDENNGKQVIVDEIQSDPLTHMLSGGEDLYEVTVVETGERGLAFAAELSPVS